MNSLKRCLFVVALPIVITGCNSAAQKVIVSHQGGLSSPGPTGTEAVYFGHRDQMNDAEFSVVFPAIESMRSVKSLSLSGTEITDRSLDLIVRLQNLEMLYLSQTGVTMNGLTKLTAMPRLKWLTIPTSVNDDECDKLRRALPNVHISRRDDG